MLLIGSMVVGCAAAAILSRPAKYAGPIRQRDQLAADPDRLRVRYLDDLVRHGVERTDRFDRVIGWSGPGYDPITARVDSMFR